MARVCVFCGSKLGDHPDFVKSAVRLGEYLSSNGHTLVYGGGSTGMMGAIADAMLKSHGSVIGVIPHHLARAELMHADVADMRVTRDMHERKATMHELSDVYVTLPGGFGTMEELFEAVTWAQLELHARPVFLLNLQGLYDGLVDMIDSMKHRGFLSPRCHSLLIVATSEEQLCRLLDDALSGV